MTIINIAKRLSITWHRFVSMMQKFISTHFFYLFIFTFTFGILLYDLIGFDYTDEFCALFLFTLFGFYVLKTSEWPINKAFSITILIFIFYLIYSVCIDSNTKKAIISDFLIQIKPYLAFFCVYSLAPLISVNQRVILRLFAGGFAIFLFFVGSANLVFGEVLRAVMGHEAYFAAATVSCSLCFLLASDFNKKSKILYLLILAIGLFSTRSKFYGFFILNIATICYFTKIERFKLSIKSMIFLSIVLGVMFVAVWQKINLYFIQGLNPDNEKDLIARFVLYTTSIEVFKDFFPFGSGFASFATFSSGEYYSDIYVKYGIENVWGISKQFHSYIADTYYPSLAQFGMVGVCLYLLFWIYIMKKAYQLFRTTRNIKTFLLTFLIVCYFAIESTTDSTYTTHRGFFIMMILGWVLSDMKQEAKRKQIQQV